MNEWWRFHTPEEMTDVYRRSKIVVNVTRDDFDHGANLRVFEAMAAGALLMTRTPTELCDLGFRAGEHFVGYERAEDVEGLVRRYLRDESERHRIAVAAQALVLGVHTYDQRVFDKCWRLFGKTTVSCWLLRGSGRRLACIINIFGTTYHCMLSTSRSPISGNFARLVCPPRWPAYPPWGPRSSSSYAHAYDWARGLTMPICGRNGSRLPLGADPTACPSAEMRRRKVSTHR